MNILILNGCPRGKYSVTLQTSLYLEIMRPRHTFRVLHVGQRIRALERDFSEVREAVEWADLIIFSYPVYTFLVPSQLYRFIELMKASDVPVAGKYVTQITTSKHFYDVTAHRFIQENCQDMGMKFIRGLSADMEDLTQKKGQKEALQFFDHLIFEVKNDIYEPAPAKQPAPAHRPVTVPETSQEEKVGDVVIVTDCGEEDAQLAAMIARFQAKLPLASRVVNLRDYPFQGGCLGCFHCATSGKCVYKDGFDDFLRSNIQTAQAIVYAFSVQDHSMGFLLKQYDDRQFCNGHRTVTMGMPTGYLVSGNYSLESNLQMVVEGHCQVGGNYLAGVATDEENPDLAIDHLATNLSYAISRKYQEPQNFYGVGGRKIFRDLIYQMQGMMKADHQFYKAHGQYDFPQKKPGTILGMYLVGALMSQPDLMKKAGNMVNEGMLMPYKKVLEQAEAAKAKRAK